MQEMYFTGQSLVGIPLCTLYLKCWLEPNFVVCLCSLDAVGCELKMRCERAQVTLISHVLGPNTHVSAPLQFLYDLSTLVTVSCGRGRQTGSWILLWAILLWSWSGLMGTASLPADLGRIWLDLVDLVLLRARLSLLHRDEVITRDAPASPKLKFQRYGRIHFLPALL